MNLYVVVGACIASFVVLHFIAVPWAQKRFRAATGPQKFARGRTVALLEVLRTTTLLGSLSALIAAIFCWALLITGGSTSSDVANSLARVRGMKSFLDQFSTGFGVIASAIIVFALWRLARAKAGQHTGEVLQRAVDLELERIRALRRDGKLEPLAPTAEMQQLDARVLELETFCAKIDNAVQQGQTKSVEGTDLHELRAAVVKELQQLAEARAIMDDRRRLSINWHPPELDPPPPETRWERVQAFFFSRGLLNSMQGMARVAFVVGILLLVPSLMSVASGPVSDRIEERVLKLDDVYLALRAEEAQKSWQQVAKAGTPPAALTAEDEVALDTIASAYEQGVSQAMAGLVGATATAIPSELRNYRARKAVLQEFSAHASAGGASPARIETAAPRVGPFHDDLLALDRAQWDAHKPRTPEGLAMRERLRKEVALASSEQWSNFKRSVVSAGASFQRPVTRAELQGALLSRLVGFSGEGLVDVPVEAAKRASVGADSISKETRKRAFDTRSREFMSSYAKTGNLETAMAAVARQGAVYSPAEIGQIKSVHARAPKVEDVISHIRSAPPSIVRERLAGVDLPAARKAGANITSTVYGANGAGRSVEALHTFDDFFPGHAAPPGGGGSGGVPPGPGGSSPKAAPRATATRAHVESEMKFRQARSFTALRGSARVGGVLIGREPERAGATLDFRAIDWDIEKERIRLTLRRGDGQVVELGPYNAGIAHLALAYAADARPVAVTMTSAAPLAELQINVHPALVDSPLGCRSIEIDRFVDTVTSGNETLKRSRADGARLLYGHLAIYRIAWAQAVNSRAGQGWISSTHPEIAKDILTRAESEARQARSMPAEILQFGLQNADAMRDQRASPVSAKPEFFNPLIVKLAATCARRSQGAVRRYEECLGQEANQIPSAEFDKDKTWDAPPPKFELWSGVRELPYKLDNDLSFAALRRPDDAGALWPFDFLVQVAFVSPAFGVAKDPKWYRDDAALDGYEDPSPWQFPLLQDPLRAGVASQVQAKRDWAEIVATMREFTLLQRLFRTAFSGGLGERFPVDRLAVLAAETAPLKPKTQRTLRWNARPGAIEMGLMRDIAPALMIGGLDNRTREAANACIRAFGNMNSLQLSRVVPEDWDAKCRFSASGATATAAGEILPPADNLARQSVIVSETRRIRRALKIADDEALAATRQGCAPI